MKKDSIEWEKERPAGGLTQRILFAAGLLTWAVPSLVWYVRRMTDGSDEPYGILALAAWAALLGYHFAKHRNLLDRFPDRMDGAAGLATAIALLLAPSFPLVHAGILVGFVSWMAIRRGAPPALLGLGILSLPVIATLEFYCGYPLRYACGWLGTGLFQLMGIPVRIEGISMWIDSSEVVIDRPCSGLKYLWFGWFVTALAGSLYGLSARRFLVFSLFSGLTLFLANTLRINLLFLLEWKGLGGAEMHEWIGLMVFAIALAAILSASRRLKNNSPNRANSPPSPNKPSRIFTTPGRSFGIAWCFLAGIGIFTEPPGGPEDRPTSRRNPTAETFGPTGEGFARLLSGGPGRPRIYESGGSVILLREMERPSRSVHPAEDCFRGAGYSIDYAPLWKDPYERNWRTFYATRDGRRWEVRQRIEGNHGWSGSDVSQWFWSAATGQSQGPWKMWVVVKEA